MSCQNVLVVGITHKRLHCSSNRPRIGFNSAQLRCVCMQHHVMAHECRTCR